MAAVTLSTYLPTALTDTPFQVHVSELSHKVNSFVQRNQRVLLHYGVMATLIWACPKKYKAVATAVLPAAMYCLFPVPMKQPPLVTDWLQKLGPENPRPAAFLSTRDELLNSLSHEVSAFPTRCISGPSGVGKTELLLELGHRLSKQGHQVYHFSELDFSSDEYGLNASKRAQMLIAWLAKGPKIVVMDEFAKLPADLQKALVFNRDSCPSTLLITMTTAEWEKLPPDWERRLKQGHSCLVLLDTEEVMAICREVRERRFPEVKDEEFEKVLQELQRKTQSDQLLSDVLVDLKYINDSNLRLGQVHTPAKK